jgi:hypothetical protein
MMGIGSIVEVRGKFGILFGALPQAAIANL